MQASMPSIEGSHARAKHTSVTMSASRLPTRAMHAPVASIAARHSTLAVRLGAMHGGLDNLKELTPASKRNV